MGNREKHSSETDWMPSQVMPGLVSVITPLYNRAQLIEATLNSVYNQTYRPIEIIVVDDGSSDESAAIVEKWANKYNNNNNFRLKLIRQTENKGAQTSRNKALSKCHGEFIQFLDADDLLKPEKIEKQVRHIRDTNADVVYGDSLEGPSWEKSILKRPGQIKEPIKHLLLGWWNPVFAYLILRKTVRATGKWDINLYACQDFDYLLRIAITGANFVYLPGITGLYLRHENSAISRTHDVKRLKSTLITLNNAQKLIDENQDSNFSLKKALAMRYLDTATRALKYDKELFKWGIKQAHLIYPKVKHPTRWRRFGITILGYKKEQRLYDFGRTIYGFVTGK